MLELIFNVGGELPVYLADTDGAPVVGVGYAEASVWIRKRGGDLATLALTAANWVEIGDGHYDVIAGAAEADIRGNLHYHASASGAVDYPGVAAVVLPIYGDGDTLKSFRTEDADGNPVSGVYVTCYRVEGSNLIYQGRQRSLNDGLTWWMVVSGSTYQFYREDPTKRVVFENPEVEVA